MTTQTRVNPASVPVTTAWTRKRAVAAATIGSALEWYDFIVYSFFAAMIGKLFFPAAAPNSQLLIGLATFGVGFFMRPWAPSCSASMATVVDAARHSR